MVISSDSKPGSIPAGAGEPPSQYLSRSITRVYPRRCGGTKTERCRGIAKSGLSPQVRGNHRPWFQNRDIFGSIPAGAGEPRLNSDQLPLRGVYPRRCGGTNCGATANIPTAGLSPQVRGNRSQQVCDRERAGSIPAGAGEPNWMSTSEKIRWVYPRRCGGTPNTLAQPRL